MSLTPQKAQTLYRGHVPELMRPGDGACHPEFPVSEAGLMGQTAPQN